MLLECFSNLVFRFIMNFYISSLDDADLHLAAGDLGSQQLVQDAESLGHDEGADAIAGHDADGDGVELGEVGDFFVSLHAVDAGKVGADELCQLFLCGLAPLLGRYRDGRFCRIS